MLKRLLNVIAAVCGIGAAFWFLIALEVFMGSSPVKYAFGPLYLLYGAGLTGAVIAIRYVAHGGKSET